MKELEIEFAQIAREHKGTIYTVCYMFSNNEDDVADLYQEILVNLWKGFTKFRGESNIRTWIYRISLNTCISFERKKHRKVDTIPLTIMNEQMPYTINEEELEEDIRKYASYIRDLVNRSIPWGCCGGCL